MASIPDGRDCREGVLERMLVMLSAIPLGVIVALTFVDVFARYLFASPVRGSLEIVQFAMAMVIFTALPLVTRHRGHVTVSLIDGLLRGRLASARRFGCDALSTVALGLMTWRLGAQAGDDLANDMRTVVLGMPHAPLTWAMFGFSALATLTMAALAWRSLGGIVGDAPTGGPGVG